jgi:hypothetical protein
MQQVVGRGRRIWIIRGSEEYADRLNRLLRWSAMLLRRDADVRI